MRALRQILARVHSLDLNGLQTYETNLALYVGDAGRNVVRRILKDHCGGNVEASILRRRVAEEMGYQIKPTRRQSGSIRYRIDDPNSQKGESDVSDYLRSGKWRYLVCDSDEAHDFQWYAIDQIKPLLNKLCKPWNHNYLHKYRSLLAKLLESPMLAVDQMDSKQTGPGVYVFYHKQRPSHSHLDH